MSKQPIAIEGAVNTLTTVGPLLPSPADFESAMSVARSASERGHFTPDEDEQVREVFSHYLRTRGALMTTLRELEPLLLGRKHISDEDWTRVFAVAFCTACMLMRTGKNLVDSCRKDRVIRKKLNEAEPRYGIPRNQFTQIYRSLTAPRNIWIFLSGVRFAEEKQQELKALANDPVVGPVIEMLEQEKPFIETSRRYYTTGRLKYRWHSFLRRHVSGFKKVSFALFKLSGSLIAEMRLKWKRKRVTPGVQRKIARMLQPGDVIITRHDDAASNLFLPGFWPHAALYIGTRAQRNSLGITADDSQRERSSDPVCILEARKDGVLFRPLDDTLNVDAFTVIRPRLLPEQIRDSLMRAMTHEGKSYDFEFDFRRSDRLVCTEVVYRAYHGINMMDFELKTRAGRVCFSAEDLLDHAIDKVSFDVIAVYGANKNRFSDGPLARKGLINSYRPDREIEKSLRKLMRVTDNIVAARNPANVSPYFRLPEIEQLAGCKLPDELGRFLAITNGCSLDYDFQISGQKDDHVFKVSRIESFGPTIATGEVHKGIGGHASADQLCCRISKVSKARHPTFRFANMPSQQDGGIAEGAFYVELPGNGRVRVLADAYAEDLHDCGIVLEQAEWAPPTNRENPDGTTLQRRGILKAYYIADSFEAFLAGLEKPAADIRSAINSVKRSQPSIAESSREWLDMVCPDWKNRFSELVEELQI